MFKNLRFIPWSGVAFILSSVALVLIWRSRGGQTLEEAVPYMIFELVLFVVCFYLARIEARQK